LLLAPYIAAAGSDTEAAGPDFEAAGPDFKAAGPDFEAAGPNGSVESMGRVWSVNKIETAILQYVY